MKEILLVIKNDVRHYCLLLINQRDFADDINLYTNHSLVNLMGSFNFEIQFRYGGQYLFCKHNFC